MINPFMSLVSKVSKPLSFGQWIQFGKTFGGSTLFFSTSNVLIFISAFHSVCSREFGKKIWKARWNYSYCAHSRVPRQDIGKCACDSVHFMHTTCSLQTQIKQIELTGYNQPDSNYMTYVCFIYLPLLFFFLKME